jgi:hypothetical protein
MCLCTGIRLSFYLAINISPGVHETPSRKSKFQSWKQAIQVLPSLLANTGTTSISQDISPPKFLPSYATKARRGGWIAAFGSSSKADTMVNNLHILPAIFPLAVPPKPRGRISLIPRSRSIAHMSTSGPWMQGQETDILLADEMTPSTTRH